MNIGIAFPTDEVPEERVESFAANFGERVQEVRRDRDDPQVVLRDVVDVDDMGNGLAVSFDAEGCTVPAAQVETDPGDGR